MLNKLKTRLGVRFNAKVECSDEAEENIKRDISTISGKEEIKHEKVVFKRLSKIRNSLRNPFKKTALQTISENSEEVLNQSSYKICLICKKSINTLSEEKLCVCQRFLSLRSSFRMKSKVPKTDPSDLTSYEKSSLKSDTIAIAGNSNNGLKEVRFDGVGPMENNCINKGILQGYPSRYDSSDSDEEITLEEESIVQHHENQYEICSEPDAKSDSNEEICVADNYQFVTADVNVNTDEETNSEPGQDSNDEIECDTKIHGSGEPNIDYNINENYVEIKDIGAGPDIEYEYDYNGEVFGYDKDNNDKRYSDSENSDSGLVSIQVEELENGMLFIGHNAFSLEDIDSSHDSDDYIHENNQEQNANDESLHDPDEYGVLVQVFDSSHDSDDDNNENYEQNDDDESLRDFPPDEHGVLDEDIDSSDDNIPENNHEENGDNESLYDFVQDDFEVSDNDNDSDQVEDDLYEYNVEQNDSDHVKDESSDEKQEQNDSEHIEDESSRESDHVDDLDEHNDEQSDSDHMEDEYNDEQNNDTDYAQDSDDSIGYSDDCGNDSYSSCDFDSD